MGRGNSREGGGHLDQPGELALQVPRRVLAREAFPRGTRRGLARARRLATAPRAPPRATRGSSRWSSGASACGAWARLRAARRRGAAAARRGAGLLRGREREERSGGSA